jgi:hypothetical protein
MDPTKIETMAIMFYAGLFFAQERTAPNLVTQYVPRKVTDVMNDELSVSFSAEEVQRALFMMHPNKARGPDGFMAGFFQKHWQLIKGDVTTTVLQFLNGGDMLDTVNNTVLALIPKVKNP